MILEALSQALISSQPDVARAEVIIQNVDSLLVSEVGNSYVPSVATNPSQKSKRIFITRTGIPINI